MAASVALGTQQRDVIMVDGEARAQEPELANRLKRGEESLKTDLIESLHSKGISGILFKAWDEQEMQAWEASFGNGRRPKTLPRERRTQVCIFMRDVIAELRWYMNQRMQGDLDDASWPDAVGVLQRYLQHHPDVENMPATDLAIVCVAVILTVQKMWSSGAWTFPMPMDWFVKQAESFAAKLQSGSGEAAGQREVQAEDIRQKEREVLIALKWKLAVPSVYTWLRALISRFHVLTRNAYPAAMGYAFCFSWQLGARLLMWMDEPVAPRRLANCLFCLGIAQVGLLPSSAIEVERVLSMVSGGGQPCQIPPQSVGAMLSLLQVVALREIEDLQEDVDLVAPAIEDMILSTRGPAAGA